MPMDTGTVRKRRGGTKRRCGWTTGPPFIHPKRWGGNKTRMPIGRERRADGNKKDRGIAAAALLNHELIQP